MVVLPQEIPPIFVDKLIRELAEKYDVDFSGYNRNFLRRRIANRMHRTGTVSLSFYRRFLMENPEELSEFLQNITINVSEFMRNPEVFVKLEMAILQDISRKIKGRVIRFWTAGCSRGEEPYSLAIILHKLSMLKNSFIQIVATDIDDIALEQARRGVYNSESLNNLSPSDKKLYFHHSKDSKYEIADKIKKPIYFKKHDIVRGPDLGKFDMIICRNVSIYFTRSYQERMYERFCNDLFTNGYLVTGKTEMPPTRMSKRFRTVDFENRIYQKVN